MCTKYFKLEVLLKLIWASCFLNVLTLFLVQNDLPGSKETLQFVEGSSSCLWYKTLSHSFQYFNWKISLHYCSFRSCWCWLSLPDENFFFFFKSEGFFAYEKNYSVSNVGYIYLWSTEHNIFLLECYSAILRSWNMLLEKQGLNRQQEKK